MYENDTSKGRHTYKNGIGLTILQNLQQSVIGGLLLIAVAEEQGIRIGSAVHAEI